jgi:hypothetical protein
VEAYENKDNTFATHITLYPIYNTSGLWTLWKLDSSFIAFRKIFMKLVTTETSDQRVKSISEEESLN